MVIAEDANISQEQQRNGYCVSVPLLHLHSERGVYAVVEVQISGAVIGPVCNPQVTVSDSTVQLLLYSVFLQETGHTDDVQLKIPDHFTLTHNFH